MRSVKVLLVEDEMIIAHDIAHHLEVLGCEICGILTEGEAVLPFLQETLPDIILMDIMLAGELDGISTVRQINEKYDLPIIYMTANTDDESFELAKATKPFAFIEKPFKIRSLIRAIELLIEHLLEKGQFSKVKEAPTFFLKDRIFVKDKDKMVRIYLKDILYIEAERAYSRIITAEKFYLMTIPLRSLEEKIPADFLMRVHRSFIINLTHIEGLQDNYVYLHKNYIPVSRSYWDEFTRRVNII